MPAVALPPTLHSSHVLHRKGRVLVLVRKGWERALPLERMLAGAPLLAWGRPVPHALVGRGDVHVLATPRGEIVAKQLRRGGVAGGLLRTWFGDARRPLREAEAAERLLAKGCRTPPVVAARVQRGPFGLSRLEIATEREMGAMDLLAALGKPSGRVGAGGAPAGAAAGAASGGGPGESSGGAFSRSVLAAAAGRTLRKAHDAGLHHRDLQAKNLLVPRGFPGPGGPDAPEAFVLLDLDRCRVAEPLSRGRRVAAIARLGRSLVKHRILPRRPGDPAATALWSCRAFFRAYGGLQPAQGGDGVVRMMRRSWEAVRRSVARHLPLWSEETDPG